MEGLSIANADLVVYVHPSQSKRVPQAIIRELSSLLFKFNEAFDGMLLAYDVNILDMNAKILSGLHPYFGVKIRANLLLFSPKPDMLLEGKAVKLTQESIHVIVLGFSSAVITAENIRKEFEYKMGSKQEDDNLENKGLFVSRSHKKHAIRVGTVIRFLVKSLDEENMHIYGSLMRADTGSIHWLHRNSNDHTLMKRNLEIEGIEPTHGIVDDRAVSLSNNEQVKKSKKRRIMEGH